MPFTLKKYVLALTTGALLAAGAVAAPLRVGVTPGALADSVNVAAQEAKAAGLDVQVIEFTDWTSPNTALVAGDLDLNYFQHQAFLDNAIAERGYRIESVAYGLLPNIGLYSKKYTQLADIPEGAKVGVANDPVNQAHGLRLLQSAGLIGLKEGAGAAVSLADVSENPRRLQLVEIEGPQLVRAVDDLALAQGYPAHYVSAGQPEWAVRALQYTTIDDLYYGIRFVAHSDRKSDPRIKQFIDLYQNSPAVEQQIHASFANQSQLYALPWKDVQYRSIQP